MSKLPPPAKDRILKAALHEFAKRGYEAASTNAIASRAKVAKGLVFHYFGDKESLCAALFDHEVKRLSEQIFGALQNPAADLFERLQQFTVLKLKLAEQHPLTVDFLLVALTESPPAIRARLLALQRENLASGWARFLEGIDGSQLRPELTLNDAIATMTVMSEGIEKQLVPLLQAGSHTLAQVTALAWSHYERLRDGLYRRG